MVRTVLLALCACLALSACSGGGGGGSSSTASSGGVSGPNSSGSTTTTTPALTNFTTVTVDNGPAALAVGTNGYLADDTPYVTVTICAPGTTNCQTIDHVILDTGSVGLRIPASILGSTLLSAMPAETDGSSNPVGECYGYVDGYAFGSVRLADFQIGGENVASMPVHVLGDSGQFATAPSSCTSGGGVSVNTVQALGGNGILGVGSTTTDCGSACTANGGYGAAIYYDCPTAGCGTIIARTAATSAPFQQLPNPVAAMAVDNNGVMVSLPAAPAAGEASMTGTIYFGIGTQTNNGLGSATVLTATGSTSRDGAGLITVTYSNKALSESFIDSGSNAYYFVDGTIPACTGSGFKGYYCPASPLPITISLTGQNAVSTTYSFQLNNAQTLFSSNNAVVPGIGVNPNLLSFDAYPNSFDLGLPFFFGHNVFIAIEGRSAGGTTGPYFAF